MTAQEFCYWLQGHFELGHTASLDEAQVKVIKEHLQLVFQKMTTFSVQPNPIVQPWTPQQPITFPTLPDCKFYPPQCLTEPNCSITLTPAEAAWQAKIHSGYWPPASC